MPKGVLYDNTRCIACRACQVACKSWNGNPGEETQNHGTYENPTKLSAKTFTAIRFREVEDDGKLNWAFAKVQCMHCLHPGCKAACPVAALQKDEENGPVVYDDTRCFGCRYCMLACPFEIPTFQWDKPVPWIRKCTFCADRLGGGLEPACVKTCPAGALKFGERDDLIAEARSRIAASPDKYIDHIYGEKEVGGTSWLYLSDVPFEDLGFRTLSDERVDANPQRVLKTVPWMFAGVAALMGGLYWFTKRRQKMSQGESGDREKEEEVAK
ncbi:MAG: 4Fe-4S dicluster domain-containing protein [Chloroflexi bacterium]|nr:4Fe-4S dicluster domain-containing protein [Chloroflexota bacterium]